MLESRWIAEVLLVVGLVATGSLTGCATLVKGSHGARPKNIADWPVLITEKNTLPPNSQIHATDVYHILKRSILDRE